MIFFDFIFNLNLKFRLFFVRSHIKDIVEIKEKNLNEKKEEKNDKIICRACKNVISKPENKIQINGQYSHTFQNPAGIVYNIGCFSSTEGCLDVSEKTKEYTWFPGFSWTITVCSKCLTHLGWHFTVNGGGFYGLILDRLTEIFFE